MQPVEINLDRSRNLGIRWANGHESLISLVDLRKACPCAECREKRRDRDSGSALPLFTPNEEAVLMTTAHDAALVGSYALKITWCDGHDMGLYDFKYLREISR